MQSNEDSDSEGAMESDNDSAFESIDDLDGTSPFIFQLKNFSIFSDRRGGEPSSRAVEACGKRPRILQVSPRKRSGTLKLRS